MCRYTPIYLLVALTMITTAYSMQNLLPTFFEHAYLALANKPSTTHNRETIQTLFLQEFADGPFATVTTQTLDLVTARVNNHSYHDSLHRLQAIIAASVPLVTDRHVRGNLIQQFNRVTRTIDMLHKQRLGQKNMYTNRRIPN